jgi:uncharacterized Zn finger protein
MPKRRWPAYVPVGRRADHSAKAIAALTTRGVTLSPVVVEGRGHAIARTFWGKAWCANLERYSDFANRLPRGRSYVRNRAVVDLQAAAGKVDALVQGNDLYTVRIRVAVLPAARWRAICADCAGEIDSLIALLRGELSTTVAARVCTEGAGLFPSPREIEFECSCPDWAAMCKHVAAVLYGIGARLDTRPDMLFALRGVAQEDLVAGGSRHLQQRAKTLASHRLLTTDDLSGLFGIDISDREPEPASPSTREPPRERRRRGG